MDDQRGAERPFDVLRLANADDGADIGAVELIDSDADGIEDRVDDDDDDEDAVPDDSDLCDFVSAPTASGCPVEGRTLMLEYSNRKRLFKGRLVSPEPACQQALDVAIVRRRSGVEVEVGVARTGRSGDFRLEGALKSSGRYRARGDVEVVAGAVECGAAQSDVLSAR